VVCVLRNANPTRLTTRLIIHRMSSPKRRKQKRSNWVIYLAVVLLEMAAILFFMDMRWMVLPVNITIGALLFTAYSRGWSQDIALCFALFYGWQLLTYWIWVPMDWAMIEVLILACTVYWIIQRPPMKSEDIGQNMGVAFYQGDNTPWIARIASLFTLKAHSVAMVYQGRAMVPTGEGFVKCVDKSSLGPNWTILDTGEQPPDLGINYFHDMNGAPVSTLGCVKACKYPLKETGIKLSPIPGILMRNLLNGRR